MKLILAFLCVFHGLFPSLAPAQTNALKPIEKRFLFIVETSADMKKLAPSIQQSIGELVETGMGEIMEDGDTLGIWTFNDQVHTGQFPMQRWRTNSTTEITRRIESFFKMQRFEKSPRIENVLPKLFPVIRSSPVITVVFVTSGSRAIQGTPFDREISDYFKKNYRQFQKEKMPFLTMLLARNGEILRHSVSPALGDVRIPKPPPAPDEPPAPKTVSAPKEDPKPIAKAVTPAPSPSPISVPAASAPIKNQALIIGKGGAQIVVATNGGISLEEEVNKKLLADEAAKAAQAEKLLAKIQETKPVITSETPAESTVPSPPQVPTSAPAENIVESINNEPKKNVINIPAVETSAPVANIITTEETKPESAPLEEGVEPKTTVTAAVPVEIPTRNIESRPPEKMPVQTQAQTPAPQLATETPAKSGSSKLVFVLGALSFVFALIIAFLLGRQSSKPPAASFITQSVERMEKK